MAGEDSAADAAPAGGVLGSIKGLAAPLIAAVHTRLQLFTTELALEGLRLRRMLLLLILAVIFFALALGLLTLLVVLVFWDGQRMLAISLLAGFYFAVSVLLLLTARAGGGRSRRPFAATLGELEKDRQRVSQ